MAPAHKHCHVGKTAADLKLKSKIAKVRQKHTGVVHPAGRIQSAGFARKVKAEKIPIPERRSIYEAKP